MALDRVFVVIDSGDSVGEMVSETPPTLVFDGAWVSIESTGWHIHLKLSSVTGVQFVEAEDNFHEIPKLYYVRFSDSDSRTLVRFYFPNPWLDNNDKKTTFQPGKLEVFEKFRDRYANVSGIDIVRIDKGKKIYSQEL